MGLAIELSFWASYRLTSSYLTYSKLPSVISGLYSRSSLLACNDPISSGPIADYFILGFSHVVPLLISFGLMADCLFWAYYGLLYLGLFSCCTITHFFRAHGRLSRWAFSVCYGLVKKWASTLAPRVRALRDMGCR